MSGFLDATQAVCMLRRPFSLQLIHSIATCCCLSIIKLQIKKFGPSFISPLESDLLELLFLFFMFSLQLFVGGAFLLQLLPDPLLQFQHRLFEVVVGRIQLVDLDQHLCFLLFSLQRLPHAVRDR